MNLIMNKNAMTMNFEPYECVIFAQTTKIGTHENKAIHCTSTPTSYFLKVFLQL